MEKITYKPGAEELWDKHSEYINEDIYSLETIAGTLMMRRSEFMKAVDGLQSENERLREVLENLIQLKDWKDKYGKDEHYTKHQPAAWDAARAALNQK
jgi:hypothetical protein